MSLASLTIADAGSRLRTGALTSVALTQAHLDRIAALDGTIGAFVAVTTETALAAAAQADAWFDAGIDNGPLQGIPVAIKDVIDCAGVPTTCGGRLRASHVPDADAAAVARLKRAGAVLLGKLATYEFGLVGPSFDGIAPPAVNPWSPAHVTGGSSSGPAAAVAAGMLRTAIGTDTGGSIRSPAGYCGVVGLKPTYGRVSRDGVFAVSPSLDHLGPLSATVAEAAVTLDALAEDARGDRAAAHLGRGATGLRISYARAWFASDAALMPEVLVAMDAAVSQLSLLGARIAEVDPPDPELMAAVGAVILHAEALEVHRRMLAEEGANYGRQAYQTLAAGVCLTKADLARARRAARSLCDAIDTGVLARHDALVTANTLATAPAFVDCPRDRPVWTAMRTLPFNVTGHPALALPIGFAFGLPMGMQIVGRAWDEAMICRIGAAFEAATDHSVQKPAGLERLARGPNPAISPDCSQ